MDREFFKDEFLPRVRKKIDDGNFSTKEMLVQYLDDKFNKIDATFIQNLMARRVAIDFNIKDSIKEDLILYYEGNSKFNNLESDRNFINTESSTSSRRQQDLAKVRKLTPPWMSKRAGMIQTLFLGIVFVVAMAIIVITLIMNIVK